jgi:hypothetical protein
VKIAVSTVWEILRESGIDPAPERASSTWAQFLRSQADALLARDFFEAVTVNRNADVRAGRDRARTPPIHLLGATAHTTAAWVTQAERNLVMDLEDAGCRAAFMIRDRDSKFPALFDAVLANAEIRVVRGGIRTPRMNSIMQRWVQTCRHGLLDRTLIWNQRGLIHALCEYERFYNAHRPHRASRTPDHYSRCPRRSPIRHRSPVSTYADTHAWAASSTTTDMPHDLHE